MNSFNLKKMLVASILVCLATAVSADAEQLKKEWELTGLKNPESVVYDPETGLIYISNVNGAADEKDGNGFISVASLNGELVTLEWVGGLDAPKGLAISDGKLYTADIDTLVEIDIATATITNRYTVPDAKFLNDVAARHTGDIFVSDMAMNRIHKLDVDSGEFIIWLESPELENPNGLLAEKDRLVVGAWGVMTDGFATETPGHLKAVSMSDKSISSIGDGSPVGNLDGVETDIDGDYYVTDWMAGKLFHIESDGTVEELLALNQGMADHEYILEHDLILLPMMKDNKLLAYKAHHSE